MPQDIVCLDKVPHHMVEAHLNMRRGKRLRLFSASLILSTGGETVNFEYIKLTNGDQYNGVEVIPDTSYPGFLRVTMPLYEGHKRVVLVNASHVIKMENPFWPEKDDYNY